MNAQIMIRFRIVGNSMIFICLTPNPKGEHLKIIELGSPPFVKAIWLCKYFRVFFDIFYKLF